MVPAAAEGPAAEGRAGVTGGGQGAEKRASRFLRSTIEIGGRQVLHELGLFYPAGSTVAGQPATAFPVGVTRAGLPIGFQAIGPYLEDRTPIRFTELVAREWGGFTRPPGYDGDL